MSNIRCRGVLFDLDGVLVDSTPAVARLVPAPPKKAQRVLGVFRGQFTVPNDFDAPLPEDLLRLFEGRKKKRSRKPKKNI